MQNNLCPHGKCTGYPAWTPCKECKADSPTLPYVLKFAERMEAKLAKNRHKGDRGGWINDDPWSLWRRIGDEHGEIMKAMEDGLTAEEIANECADTANFCMMLADWFTERAKATPENTELTGANPDQ